MSITYPRERNKNFAAGKKLINVNETERILSLASGALMLYYGLQGLVKHPFAALTKTLAASVLLYRGATGHCPAYSLLGWDSTKTRAINTKVYLTVNRPRNEVYRFWRRLENLPLFMRHLESVEEIDDKYSRWKAKIPGGMGLITWNAEIVEDKDYFIGWQSVQGSPVFNTGKVEFRDAPGGQGTEIQAVISYHSPIGGLGTGLAKLLNPVFENYVREDIRNFKQFMETGEIPRS